MTREEMMALKIPDAILNAASRGVKVDEPAVLARASAHIERNKEMYNEAFAKAKAQRDREPVGALAGPITKAAPFIPYYMANGNVVLEKWTESFVDRAGNRAILTKVKYKHPKKTEVNEAVIRVQWENGNG